MEVIKETPFTLGLLPILIIFGIHFSRNDHQFLEQLRGKAKAKYLIAEYLLVLSPFWIYSIFISTAISPVFILSCICLGFVPAFPFSRKISLFKVDFIPNRYFEFKAGIRNAPLTWIGIYTLSLLGFLHPGAAILSWLLMLLALPEFYRESEPWPLLMVSNLSPNAFLWVKWRLHFLFLGLMSIPGLLIILIFHTHLWWICLSFLLLLAFNVFFNIVCKYGFYEQGETSSSNQTWLSIGIICMLLPPLLPLPLIMSILFYRKSITKLSYYFYA